VGAAPPHRPRAGRLRRLRDLAGLGFAVYATWRAFENAYYQSGPYLSPFYSPAIVTKWTVLGRHFSPALFILPFPLFFRATCYYYRKAYYRAFFWDPPACAVGEIAPRKNYTGERAFPFVLQNLHRYAFYGAVVILVVLWWDALLAFDFGGRFGVGLGSLVFLANIVLLSLYTFSCHSWRHLSGGCSNCFSCSAGAKAKHTVWERVTRLNENHALWAWLSLFSVRGAAPTGTREGQQCTIQTFIIGARSGCPVMITRRRGLISSQYAFKNAPVFSGASRMAKCRKVPQVRWFGRPGNRYQSSILEWTSINSSSCLTMFMASLYLQNRPMGVSLCRCRM